MEILGGQNQGLSSLNSHRNDNVWPLLLKTANALTAERFPWDEEMKKPETKFKEKVLKDLKTVNGIWFFKSQEVAVHGIPDVFICVRGWLIVLELKPDEYTALEPLQEYVLNEIRAAGGRARKVHPKNWPAVFSWIKSIADGTLSLDESSFGYGTPRALPGRLKCRE